MAAVAGGSAEAALAGGRAFVATHEALTDRGGDAAEDGEQGDATKQASHESAFLPNRLDMARSMHEVSQKRGRDAT